MFKAAEVRFNTGVGAATHLPITKDGIDIANVNLIGARYDFVLCKKILDYYFDNMYGDMKNVIVLM